MTMCDADRVRALFYGGLLTLEGFDEGGINTRIARAENYVKARLTAFAAAVVAAWTTTANTPDLLQDMVAKRAAAYIVEDTQSAGSPEATRWVSVWTSEVDKTIGLLNFKTIRLIGKDGAEIIPGGASIYTEKTAEDYEFTKDTMEFA